MRKPDIIYGRINPRIHIEVNCIYKSFELIGILESYIEDNHTHNPNGFNIENFIRYYENHIIIPRFKYRNLGVKVIFQQLQQQYDNNFVGISGTVFSFTTNSLKRTGIWFWLSRSRVYEGTDYIVKAIFYYLSNSYLKDFYIQGEDFYSDNVSKYLKFQYDCLHDYVRGDSTGRKAAYYNTMETNMEKNIMERNTM